ncbi:MULTISPECIES: hypothetical protein [Franconibacter]|nr:MULTISPECIES: hypothetical protein [Franconibacter]
MTSRQSVDYAKSVVRVGVLRDEGGWRAAKQKEAARECRRYE